jgi:hypothetical protein
MSTGAHLNALRREMRIMIAAGPLQGRSSFIYKYGRSRFFDAQLL